MQDLCHSHSDEATIQQKISTIINCFINSSVPPALQIDIPPEQAQHVLEKRHQLGPYIFREAQVCVCVCVLWFVIYFFWYCMLAACVHVLCLYVDVSVQWIAEILARVSRAEQQHPRGATPSTTAVETRQTQSQSAETEEKRGGGRGRVWKEESPGKEIVNPEEITDDFWGIELNVFTLTSFVQEELERAVSRFEEEEVRDDEDEVEEQEEGCEKKQFRTPSRELQTPTQAVRGGEPVWLWMFV